jgi:hypothetical protein
MALSNELYMAVLPMVHLGINQYGLTEQVITLLPDRKQATEFFPDEVQDYVNILERRTKYLIGGHVSGYTFEQVKTDTGRVIVRVYQHVF